MSDDTSASTGAEPSVFLDETVLGNGNLQSQPMLKGPQYTVNERTFYDDQNNSGASSLVQFAVYAERTTNISANTLVPLEDDTQYVYCSTPESNEDKEEPSSAVELNTVIQKISHGLIINSNVFLTDEQWNTLMYYDGNLLRCVACELFIDIESSEYHVQRDSHRGVLDKCRPLARFDLSITRKIRNQYHCGVCNEAFNLKDETEHFTLKSHEGNLLSAINKVSDFEITENGCNDTANGNNDCYHFNATAIYNARNNGNKSNDNYFNPNMINYDDDNASYEDDCDYEYEDQDIDYDEENDSMWGSVAQKPLNTGSSYATMLKKPKTIDVPMFLEKDLGDKKVKVRFDSYHMLIKPKINRFYCMVCKEYSHIREKAKHCSDEEHLAKLSLCEVVDWFGDYYIRVMDDKLYHCGHCNNLVVKNDMDDHLEDKHDKKPNAIESAKNKNNDIKDFETVKNGSAKLSVNNVENKKTKVTNEIKQSNLNDKIENKNNDVKKNVNNNMVENNENNNNDRNKNNNLSGSDSSFLFAVIILEPFGYKIAVSLLSYNVVLKRPYYNDFYCGLCDILLTEDSVLPHIHGILHIQMLQRTPFIVPFNCNLIRAVREKLHCAICNIPVSAYQIYLHLQEAVHLKLLQEALKVNMAPLVTCKHLDAQNNIQNPQNVPHDKIVLTETKNRPTLQTSNETEITKTKLTKDPPADTQMPLTKTDTVATKKETITETRITKDDEMELLLNDSVESVELDFNDSVYVKIKNSYFKISLASYNTLVHIGDGSRYCFVCTTTIVEEDLTAHVKSQQHENNIKHSKFVDKYDNILLRQIFLLYHCSICNVLITRRELKNHINWIPHKEETNSTVTSKRCRQNDLKAGKALHVANFVKEVIYLNEKEPTVRVLYKVVFTDKTASPFVKKNKIVTVSDVVLKVDFDNWHGVTEVNGVMKCQLCQVEFSPEVLGAHVRGNGHVDSLGREFKEDYTGHLLRQINESTLHCIVCNTEVSDKFMSAREHTDGRRHRAALAALRARSQAANTYSDCEDDTVQL